MKHTGKRRIRGFVLVLLLACGLFALVVYRQMQQRRLDYALVQAVKRAKRTYDTAMQDEKRSHQQASAEAVALLEQGANPNALDGAGAPTSVWGMLFHRLLPPPQAATNRPAVPALVLLLEGPGEAEHLGNSNLVVRTLSGGSIENDTIRAPERRLTDGLVREFLKHEAKANVRSPDGRTPLMQAAIGGYEESAMALIEQGADINAQDKNGGTALMYSCCLPRVWKALLERGAQVLPADKNGNTALHYAIWDNTLALALIKHGADVRARNQEGQTPLHSAAIMGKEGLVKALLAAGADVDARNKEGETPLVGSVHQYTNHSSTSKVLLQAGADINARDNNGRTVLMKAADRQDPDAVGWLLKNGANANLKTPGGNTALGFAQVSHAAPKVHAKIIRMLRKAGAK
jgi:ankyrin repeat protein